jgi:short-subunit dehydrogenase
MTGFHRRYGPCALIAGGSEGLGFAFAAQAAARGLDLVLVARRAEPLARAADLLRARYGVRVHAVVADLAAPQTHAELLPAATDGLQIGLLVGNAAYAPVGPFLDLDPDAVLRVLQLNCQATVHLGQGYLPGMVERRRGGFVIVSSAAGLQGLPGVAAYAATKAFGRILAESLWAELRPSGVDVVACVAGAVQTPGLASSGLRRAAGTLPPMRVAAETYDHLGRGPTVVPGRFMRVATGALRLLPRSTAIGLVRRASADLTPWADPAGPGPARSRTRRSPP